MPRPPCLTAVSSTANAAPAASGGPSRNAPRSTAAASATWPAAAPDIDAAVKSGRAAFATLLARGKATGGARKIPQRFAEDPSLRRTNSRLLETLDMGKPIKDASRSTLTSTARTIAWYAEAVDRV